MIRTAGGEMQIIRVCDRIDGGKAVEIAKDRVVVNIDAAEAETVILRIQDGKQRI